MAVIIAVMTAVAAVGVVMTDLLERASRESEYYLNEQVRQVTKQVAPPNPDDDCFDCGKPIGAKRKQAMPSAVRCIACQNLLESKALKRGIR